MTIIDFMRQKLAEYPKIAEFLGGEDIHIDFTGPDPVNYGLSSSGDTVIKKDLAGNQTRRHNFALYAVNQSFTDYNRLANSNFLLELAYWLDGLPREDGLEAEVDGKRLKCKFLKATTANGMVLNIPTGNINDGVMYQLQIQADYSVERN